MLTVFDFGDAPDSYSTVLASNGPSHELFPTNDPLRLGFEISAESDGQPSVGAVDATDDDGLLFFTAAVGSGGELEVIVNGDGGTGAQLDAWLDLNQDGDFDDAGEQIIVNATVGASVTNNPPVPFDVPPSALAGSTILRLRLSSAGNLSYDGPAADGEVEDYEVFVDRFEDFGDAADSYRTLLTNDGPRHLLVPANDPLRLGNIISPEQDGQPSQFANDATDDDGLFAFSAPAGSGGEFEVFVSGNNASGGRLDAWIDYNQDGDFSDVGEQILVNVGVVDGINRPSFSVPSSALAGPTIMRLRLSSAGGLSYDGGADDGEVEDYEVFVERLEDFGDAPDSYSTLLASNGPRHLLAPLADPLKLGFSIGPEMDGQPSPGATDAFDDDGLSQFNAFAGNLGELEVFVSGNNAAGGALDAWLDYNQDGDFTDPGEQIFAGTSVADGFNLLTFDVPTSVAGGVSILRLRLSSVGGLSYDGGADDGEVEDYEVFVERLEDFGDAPDSYSTLLASNGPRHLLAPLADPLKLGFSIGPEMDGQPSTNSSDAFDDDGLFLFNAPVGNAGSMEVVVSGNNGSGGLLDAWLDYNQDGDFADAGEHIFMSESVADGFTFLPFDVPASAPGGATTLRLRISSAGGLSFDGNADDGEVEDFEVFVERIEDFGDAPATYDTLLADDGPRHLLAPLDDALKLGFSINPESDGQPSQFANDAFDDDGLTQFIAAVGNVSQLEVFVSGNGGSGGFLDAWLDYNQDGDFADVGEQIFASTPVTDGYSLLSFDVPASVPGGASILRLRLSSAGELAFNGSALDGEVEDYEVIVERYEDFGDAPETYSTLLADDGPRHLLVPLDDPLQLGFTVAPELDGQPSPNANDAGDDDGLGFFSARAGDVSELEVFVTGNGGAGGVLDAWLDYNGDGDFTGAGEQIFAGATVADGYNLLSFDVPATTPEGPTVLRLRLSSTGGLGFSGFAADGEVEDYEVFVDRFEDFGDAPASYGTLLGDDGPRHLIVPFNDPLRLGSSIADEVDGQPSPNANGAFDDDGLFFFDAPAGNVGQLEVFVNGNGGSGGALDAWLDYNHDGDFADPGEQIFVGEAVSDGFNLLPFDVPLLATAGTTFLRLRLSESGGLSPEGSADSGEVEDYEVNVLPALLTLDIPDTAISENGGFAIATLSRNTDTKDPLTVTVASSDISEAAVPTSVTIPAGQVDTTFRIDAVDDLIYDQTRTVSITAEGLGFDQVSDSLDIIDDETLGLSLSFTEPTIAENESTSLVVTLTTLSETPTIVQLSSSDNGEAAVPTSVTVPAGDQFGTVSVSGVVDNLVDGDQSVVIAATISGIADTTASLTVSDSDSTALELSLSAESIDEGETAVLTVSLTTPTTSPTVVTLSSNDTGEATLPASVTIPAEQTSADVVVSAALDNQFDMDELVTISASASGLEEVETTLAVRNIDPESVWHEIAFEDFENGFGIFTDGGNDARLYTSGTRAHQGDNAINLQDNSGVASSMTLTDGMELAAGEFTKLRVDFWFYARSFETGEDFWLQYSDGSAWQTIATWTRGTDFQNNQFNFASVEVTDLDVVFSDNASIRFIADASDNRDDVYIDEVRIAAFGPNLAPVAVDDFVIVDQDTPVTIDVLANDTDPNSNTLTVNSFSQGSNGTVTLNGDGTVTYTPNGGFLGTDTFAYTVIDSFGATSTATVEVSVRPPFSELAFEDFENGFCTYTDGGNDALLYTGGDLAHQGNNAINLQDNSGVASSIELTDGLDLETPGYSELKVEFWFQAVSFESNEDFLLEYFDGTNWLTIRSWVRGVDFNNNEFNFASVVISESDYAFSNNAKIRLRADASGNGDDVYIDEIRISAR